MKNYLLGLDIGTSGLKAAIFSTDGKEVFSASRQYPTHCPRPGWAEQNPEDWWNAAVSVLAEASKAVPLGEIAAIGVDGQSWSAIPVDKQGRVLKNTPIWLDTRSAFEAELLRKAGLEEELFRVSGNPLSPQYSDAKVLWTKRNEPEIYRATHRFLQSNSYLIFRLTGEMTQDVSQGYGYHFFDMKELCWDAETMEKMELDPKKLPPVFACCDVVGTVSKACSAETGLPCGAVVVAGGLDAAAGSLGVGVIYAGEVQEQGGQAGGMSICTERFLAHPKLIVSAHVVPGKWLLQGGTVGGGGALRWFEREFGGEERTRAAQEKISGFDALTRLAENVEAGSEGLIFLPYLSGERSPVWDPDAKGIYYGVDYAKTKAHFIRATLEGVAYSLRHNLETAGEGGAEVLEMVSMGGASKSALWMQIKSDVTGRPMSVAASDTATVWGAAILAGMGAGIYRSFDEAVKIAERPKTQYRPNAENTAVYQKRYETYLKLYENTKELNRI